MFSSSSLSKDKATILEFQASLTCSGAQARSISQGADTCLPTLLKCLVRCCKHQELLACRVLCRQGPPFASAGIVNSDAAWLAVHYANLSLRRSFSLIERRLCHHSSSWRHGFNRRRRNEKEAAFWICRGISRIINEQVPRELEELIFTFCSSSSWVALESKELRSLNDVYFHWHRKFSQGATGPQRAVHLAYKTLGHNGALILNVAEGISVRRERSVNAAGKDITKEIFSDAQLIRSAVTMLAEARLCMEAHPRRFGQPLQNEIEEDKAQKDEIAEEEARLDRWRELGYYVDDADVDARM